MSLDHSPNNPMRVVHWRWGRAGALVASGRRPSRRRDDRWTVAAYRFRMALAACGGEEDLEGLEAADPGLFWAYRLYKSREGANDPQRIHAHALEARVMADQDRPTIAERLSASESVVDAYEAVFFDVRTRLANTDYVAFQVLGPAVYLGIRERQYDLLWKLFALWGGPHVVDLMISTFQNPLRPSESRGVGAFVADVVRGSLSRKAMIAAHAIEIDKYSAVPVIEQYLRLVEIEKKNEVAGGGGQGSMVEAISGMLASLPFSVGSRSAAEFGRPAAAVPAAAAFARATIELSADELATLAAGGELAGIGAAEDYEFPPAARKALPGPKGGGA